MVQNMYRLKKLLHLDARMVIVSLQEIVDGSAQRMVYSMEVVYNVTVRRHKFVQSCLNYVLA